MHLTPDIADGFFASSSLGLSENPIAVLRAISKVSEVK